MKKIYVLLLVTATVFSATHAQTNSDLQFKKGDVFLGGSIGFSNLKDKAISDEVKITTVNVAPGLSFFTKPNRVVGFSLNYNYGENKSTSVNNNSAKSNGFGVAVYKQYWNSLGKNFYFVVDGRLNGEYNYSKSYSSYFESKSKTTSLGLSINPGVAYRINKRLVLDLFFNRFLAVNYAHSNNKRKNFQAAEVESKLDQVNIFTGFSNFTTDNLQFGFRYVL